MKSAVAAMLCFLLALPAWGQKALSLEGMSEQQRADYRKLMRGYLDTFRLLGRSRFCGSNFDAEPFFREVVRRHGETSELARNARASFAAGAENLIVSPEVDPAPPAPMPCDVVAFMKEMRLPDLPASLK